MHLENPILWDPSQKMEKEEQIDQSNLHKRVKRSNSSLIRAKWIRSLWENIWGKQHWMKRTRIHGSVKVWTKELWMQGYQPIMLNQTLQKRNKKQKYELRRGWKNKRNNRMQNLILWIRLWIWGNTGKIYAMSMIKHTLITNELVQKKLLWLKSIDTRIK